MKTRKITFDTVTGRMVDPRQSQSFDGRFSTQECKWNGDEWEPVQEQERCPQHPSELKRRWYGPLGKGRTI